MIAFENVTDEEAEAECAAAVVSNPCHARGLEMLIADDFYFPRYRRLFELRDQLADVVFIDDRESLAASLADVPIADVRRLVARRGAMIDFSEAAERVRNASRRRKVMAVAEAVFERLGSGAPLEEVLPLLAGVAA